MEQYLPQLQVMGTELACSAVERVVLGPSGAHAYSQSRSLPMLYIRLRAKPNHHFDRALPQEGRQ